MPGDKKKSSAAMYIIITVIITLYLVPVLFMFLLSFKPVGSPMGSALLSEGGLTLRNYAEVISSGKYTKFLLNGFEVSLAASVISLTVGFCTAYAFSRFRFRLKEPLFIGLLGIKALPGVLTSIAFFHIFVRIKLYDSLWSLILLDSLMNIPLAVFMLRNFVDAIPKELDEAALLDGCGQFGYLRRVIFPLTRTGLGAVFVQCFLLSWNEYMYATIFITSEKFKMPTVVIYDFIGQWSTNYIGIMTFAVLLSLPIIIVFLCMQKYFVEGMLAGSEK